MRKTPFFGGNFLALAYVLGLSILAAVPAVRAQSLLLDAQEVVGSSEFVSYFGDYGTFTNNGVPISSADFDTTITATTNELTFSFFDGGIEYFNTVPTNGTAIFLLGGVDNFGSVTIGSTDISGFTNSNLYVSGNEVTVNFSGISPNDSSTLVLDYTTEPAPEPSSLALAGTGLAGWLGWRRRK